MFGMQFTEKQKGVCKGVCLGALISIALLTISACTNPFNFSHTMPLIAKFSVVARAAVLLALCLGMSVGRLAKQRFFTPEDIDGGGLSSGSEQSKIRQSILQNTLEQTVLALLVYLAWASIMPTQWMSVIPAAALMFLVGRMLFFWGYAKGAPSRSLGFALTFYPSMFMLFSSSLMLLWHLIRLIGI
jgi:uncharacterized membrane protein YecN with MAPEG domain